MAVKKMILGPKRHHIEIFTTYSCSDHEFESNNTFKNTIFKYKYLSKKIPGTLAIFADFDNVKLGTKLHATRHGDQITLHGLINM